MRRKTITLYPKKVFYDQWEIEGNRVPEVIPSERKCLDVRRVSYEYGYYIYPIDYCLALLGTYKINWISQETNCGVLFDDMEGEYYITVQRRTKMMTGAPADFTQDIAFAYMIVSPRKAVIYGWLPSNFLDKVHRTLTNPETVTLEQYKLILQALIPIARGTVLSTLQEHLAKFF